MPDTDKNGIILSYTVNYQATPEGNPQQNQVVNASTREVTLTGLKKNTEYKIEVFANTSKGGGKKSEPPTTVQTDEDSKYTIAEVTVRLLLQLHRRSLQVCNIAQIYIYCYGEKKSSSIDGVEQCSLSTDSRSLRQRPVR